MATANRTASPTGFENELRRAAKDKQYISDAFEGYHACPEAKHAQVADPNERATICVMVKHILRRYGYPPDKQEKATQMVLEQTEVLCRDWTVA